MIRELVTFMLGVFTGLWMTMNLIETIKAEENTRQRP